MPQLVNIVKIAIQMPGALPQLIQLDQLESPRSGELRSAVRRRGADLHHGIGEFIRLLGHRETTRSLNAFDLFHTSQNRLDIKNGYILRLTKAPGRCAEDLFRGIQSSDSGVRCDSLKELASVSTDVTFAQEFISRDGHLVLVKIVEESSDPLIQPFYSDLDCCCVCCRSNVIMTHTLTAFMELMDHGIVSWENLSSTFIKKVLSQRSSRSLMKSVLSLSHAPSFFACLVSPQIAGYVNAKPTDASIQQVFLGHPGEHGAEQFRPFPAGQAGSNDGEAHRPPAGVRDSFRDRSLGAGDRLKTHCPLRPQDKPADPDQSHGPAHGAAADGGRIGPTGASAACNIIHSSGSLQDEMAHYLYVLQSLTLNHLENRMMAPMDFYNQASSQLNFQLLLAVQRACPATVSEILLPCPPQDQRDVLHYLRQLAFESESESSLSNERRRSLCAKEFKKLGFSNNSNPGQDLVRTPPGLLALDTMYYFAKRYPDAYSRFVLENSSREDKHECPFARSSIQLTLILCEILRIGEAREWGLYPAGWRASETGSDYHPIFFNQDRLLEELFCVCIQLLNKTWKEMRATQEDFDKVSTLPR
ncbi:unnamed protein product [Tetraodon nigroviridis]|uniref:(spotted green pufferfish) hypothetical protein n=1 Tax=Tetraodon nigroviridis TaxID=99883 RepID=Q4SKD8_TETNG|nr:unnamed protein product [Tetraodon nigroviridis]